MRKVNSMREVTIAAIQMSCSRDVKENIEKENLEKINLVNKKINELKINNKNILDKYSNNNSEKNLKNKKALIFPLAFCIDNSETVFELAVQYAKIARERNFTFYKVCKCPNDRDEFAEFLLDLAKNEK